MTEDRVIVDTNIVSAHFKAEPAIVANLTACEIIYLPLIVLGELSFGAHKSPNTERNLARISRFREAAELLLPDQDTAATYGLLKSELMAKGAVIPENDLWIAALARQHDLPVASRDGHFASVPGVRWLKW